MTRASFPVAFLLAQTGVYNIDSRCAYQFQSRIQLYTRHISRAAQVFVTKRVKFNYTTVLNILRITWQFINDNDNVEHLIAFTSRTYIYLLSQPRSCVSRTKPLRIQAKFLSAICHAK